MNYLTEIRLFYDWLETHHLSPSSIALWHGLMYIANRAGYAVELDMLMHVTAANFRVDEDTLSRLRGKCVKEVKSHYILQKDV